MSRGGLFVLGLIMVVVFVGLTVGYYAVMPGVETAQAEAAAAAAYVDPQALPLQGEPAYPSVKMNGQPTLPYYVHNCTTAKKETVVAGDKILADLWADHIAQTVVLCMPTGVKDQTSYAIRFNRFMKLGMADGPRKNNGFVWLISYDKETVNVAYGAGLGLPSFTAIDLGPIQDSAEKAFVKGGIDAVITTTVKMYDAMAREKLPKLNPVAPVYGKDSSSESSSSEDNGWVVTLFIKYYYVILPLNIVFALMMLLGINTLELMYWSVLWPLRLAALFKKNDDSGHQGGGGGGSKRGSS